MRMSYCGTPEGSSRMSTVPVWNATRESIALNPEEVLSQGMPPSPDAKAFSSRITASPASSRPTALTATELRPNCDT